MEENVTPSPLAPYPVSVVMERVRLEDRWGSERWEAKGVVRDTLPPGSAERVIVEGERMTRMLFPGMTLRLHVDEAEGYYLNLTSPQPRIFVLWRLDEDGIARPRLLSASYHEGARWMDAEDTVDGVALPPDLMPWIAGFVAVHYQPEPPKKRRYASSKDKGVASRRGGET